MSNRDEERIAELARSRGQARSRFSSALGSAKTRFKPSNLRDEMIDKATDAAMDAGRDAAELAGRHKGKLAAAGGAIGLFLARKPLIRQGHRLWEAYRDWRAGRD
ncbi:MAG: hypothetical protein R3E02_04985 [Blastomonas sp.]